MIMEILLGGLAGLATYIYLHHLDKKNAEKELQKRVQEATARNAAETETKAETVNWLNFLIKHWYLVVDEKLQEKIKVVIQGELNEMSLPAPVTGVELISVTFGQNPPFIEYSRTSRKWWTSNPNKMNLELFLGPRVHADDFELVLNVEGIGEVTMKSITFSGKLKVTILIDKSLPFPCVQQVYFTFQERPDIKFDLNYGLIDIDAFPGMQEKIMNQIEEVISDTLVDPGRFLIDMSEQKLKMMLIKGVRKLKRTVLHVQVNVSKDNASKEKSSKKRRISVTLNSGGSDHSSDIELKEEPQTLNIWFPLAVLQEEIRLTSHKVKMGKDEKIVDMIIDVNSLTNDKNTELSRSHVKEMVIVVKAITSDLPHIPIRQKGEKVYDYSKYFKIPQLTTSEMMRCPSGLVYLHIHRATGLPAKDMKHFGSSDPYCVVVLNKEDTFKTQVVYKQLDPVFNFFEDFFVQNIASISELEVKVFDFDNFSDDDYIGNVKINLSNVFPKVVDKGFEVKDTNGKQVGLIYLSIIFRPIEFPPTSHNLSNILLNNFGTVDIL